ncbi:MAG: hypothetical protein QXY40_05215 [Candidatus Methanomethylicia archaeon]
MMDIRILRTQIHVVMSYKTSSLSIQVIPEINTTPTLRILLEDLKVKHSKLKNEFMKLRRLNIMILKR